MIYATILEETWQAYKNEPKTTKKINVAYCTKQTLKLENNIL